MDIQRENALTREQKDQMFIWLEEARRAEYVANLEAKLADPAFVPPPAGLWWDACSDPVAARAFVAEHLPHLLEAQP